MFSVFVELSRTLKNAKFLIYISVITYTYIMVARYNLG